MGEAEQTKYKTYFGHARYHKGTLEVSDFARISKGVTIELTGNVFISDEAELSRGVEIITHKHHWNHSIGLRREVQKVEPVSLTIAPDAFIGINAIILGVGRIGKGAIIGAGAVLTKDVPDYEVWVGNPARKIRERGKDKDDFIATRRKVYYIAQIIKNSFDDHGDKEVYKNYCLEIAQRIMDDLNQC